MRRESRYAEENTASPSDRLKSLEKEIQLQKAKVQGLYDAYLYDDAEREEKKLNLLEKQYTTEKKQDLDRFIAEWTEEIDHQRQESRGFPRCCWGPPPRETPTTRSAGRVCPISRP